jgi:serine/threonine protein kinase/N-acetylneuraminic acid mutarotase
MDERDSRAALERYRLIGVQETGWKAGKLAGSLAGAAVVELKYLGLRCTAKAIRTTNSEDASFICNLEQECSRLSRLGHPHVVQFMGVYYQPGRDNPLIVSEHLPLVLSQCLDHYGTMPEEISYSILNEVALGLLYLHEQSPPMLHRNLSADTVLLTRDMVAKIADVGVAQISDPIANNEDPGAVCHLPPEAFGKTPKHSTKTDSFSYGVLMVHVLSGRRPVQAKLMSSFDSCGSRSSFQKSLSFSEADLREEFLSEIGADNPLMSLIMSCLSNNAALRPEVEQVVYRVSSAASQNPASFVNKIEMLKQICADVEEKTNLKFQIESLTSSDSCPRKSLSELEQLHLKVKSLTAENIALKANLRANSKVEGFRKQNGSETRTNGRIRRPGLKRTEAMPEDCDSIDMMTPVQLRQGRLEWTRCNSLPVGMFQAKSVVINGMVYIGGGLTEDVITDHIVFEYDPVQDSWMALPPLPVVLFGIGQLLGDLVAIGGKYDLKVSDDVYVFDRQTYRWKQTLPSLLTARYSPAVVSHQTNLLVCGGLEDEGVGDPKVVSSCEVINAEGFRWYVGGYLSPCASVYSSSCVVIHDACYLVGGYRSTPAISASQSASSTALSVLLSPDVVSPSSWRSLPDTPYLQTTGASLGGCLLALGGAKSAYTMPVQRAIHAYSPTTESWIYIGDLPFACCHSTAVTLPSGELLVIGGWVKPGKNKRSLDVYRGSLTL